jgi:hypothetical protein
MTAINDSRTLGGVLVPEGTQNHGDAFLIAETRGDATNTKNRKLRLSAFHYKTLSM